MASIEKRQTKEGVRYRARITLKGHPRISETFDTRSKAKLWAERTTEAMRQYRYQPDSEAEQHTIRDLVDRYIEEKLPTLARSRDYRRIIEWWGAELGWHTRLSQVTPAAITRARDRLTRGHSISGRVPGPSTVRRYLTTLGGAMAIATKDWFWMDDNPCRKVRRPGEPRGRVRFLDEDERTRLLTVCKAHPHLRLYPLVVMALSTGARRGELLNLKWEDVDLGRGIATLHETKNGERRALAITGIAAEVMAEWNQMRQIGSDLVFPSPTGRATFPHRLWKQALDDAGIADFHFHDLRHCFASYLAMSGATLAELAEAMGHKTLAMVKRYAHLTEGHTASVVARMTEQFLNAA